jgi:hypothetical protein
MEIVPLSTHNSTLLPSQLPYMRYIIHAYMHRIHTDIDALTCSSEPCASATQRQVKVGSTHHAHRLWRTAARGSSARYLVSSSVTSRPRPDALRPPPLRPPPLCPPPSPTHGTLLLSQSPTRFDGAARHPPPPQKQVCTSARPHHLFPPEHLCTASRRLSASRVPASKPSRARDVCARSIMCRLTVALGARPQHPHSLDELHRYLELAQVHLEGGCTGTGGAMVRATGRCDAMRGCGCT